ncbi:hypothetical protein PFISCL1PPCAC_22414, partial [Pristionchus fissidentatus]
MFMCKHGQGEMQMVVNETDVPIYPPVCADNGSWLVTFPLLNTTTQVAENITVTMPSTDAELQIKCLHIPLPEAIVEGSSMSLIIGLIIGIILLVVFVAGIAICFVVKRRKPRAPSSSLPPTSGTTKTTGSKGSNGESEPLTSAIISITGDSVEAKKDKQPPVAVAHVKATAKVEEAKKEKSEKPAKKQTPRKNKKSTTASKSKE